MALPVTIPLSSPVATLTIDLTTTVQAIAIPRSVAGQIAGLRFYVASGGSAEYQILPNYELAADDTAPTSDHMPIAAGGAVPQEIGIHGAGAGGGDLHVMVWAASGTPTLHVAPVPVGR